MILNKNENIIFVKNYNHFKKKDNLCLINRNGISVDSTYNGKKYRIIQVDYKFFTFSERICRFVNALFLIFSSCFLALEDQQKQQEIYDLIFRKIDIITKTVIKYRLPNSKEKIKSVLDFLKNDPSYDVLIKKCKKNNFNFKLDTIEKEDKKAILKAIAYNKNFEVIKYFIKKNFYTKDNLLEFFLWKALKSSINLVDGKNMNLITNKLCKLIKHLIETGADLNKTVTCLYWRNGCRKSPHLSFLTRYFCIICEPFPDFKRLVCLQEEILSHEERKIHYNLYTYHAKRIEKTDGSIVEIDYKKLTAKFEQCNLEEESKRKNIKIFTELGEKYRNVINSIFNNYQYHPLITLLVSNGAKNIYKNHIIIALDACAAINNFVVNIIRKRLALQDRFLIISLVNKDRESTLKQFPSEILYEICKKMLYLPYIYSPVYPTL